MTGYTYAAGELGTSRDTARAASSTVAGLDPATPLTAAGAGVPGAVSAGTLNYLAWGWDGELDRLARDLAGLADAYGGAQAAYGIAEATAVSGMTDARTALDTEL